MTLAASPKSWLAFTKLAVALDDANVIHGRVTLNSYKSRKELPSVAFAISIRDHHVRCAGRLSMATQLVGTDDWREYRRQLFDMVDLIGEIGRDLKS